MGNQNWERMEYLRNRIQDQQILKDAQVLNGPDYQFFQNEITQPTNEQRIWEQRIGQLDRMEAKIATADGQARSANRNLLHAAGKWLRLATACGLIGVLLLTLSFQWSLILPAAGVMLALALGAVLLWTRAHTSARNEKTRANDQPAELQAQRDELIPPSHPPTDPFPLFSHEVIVRDR